MFAIYKAMLERFQRLGLGSWGLIPEPSTRHREVHPRNPSSLFAAASAQTFGPRLLAMLARLPRLINVGALISRRFLTIITVYYPPKPYSNY